MGRCPPRELSRSSDRTAAAVPPDGFLFGVATAGFQVEGGYNGPGQPANNWLAWEQVGRVEPSGNAVGLLGATRGGLDRAAALGCNSFRLGVEWARVVPDDGRVGPRRPGPVRRRSCAAASSAASSRW